MLRAIIVDDEPKSLKNLEILIGRFVKNISVATTCRTVTEAIAAIEKYRPDIVFLDIQMQNETGFDLLSRIEHIDFEVIFVTAYSDFAIQAIKFSAIDYLLKPIDVEELKSAVKKVEDKRLGKVSSRLRMLQDNLRGQTNNHKIALPATDGLVFIPINQILYCEASSNYTVFHTMDKKQYVVCKTLKEYEELLMTHNFFRIHHSYLVNLDEIKKYVKGEGGHVVLNNNVSLDVSKRKKADFLNRLNDKAS
jgi:two-component system LytT family response regulator